MIEFDELIPGCAEWAYCLEEIKIADYMTFSKGSYCIITRSAKHEGRVSIEDHGRAAGLPPEHLKNMTLPYRFERGHFVVPYVQKLDREQIGIVIDTRYETTSGGRWQNLVPFGAPLVKVLWLTEPPEYHVIDPDSKDAKLAVEFELKRPHEVRIHYKPGLRLWY